MNTEDILKEAKRLTNKEYSWWEIREPEQLFGNEIISLTQKKCLAEVEKVIDNFFLGDNNMIISKKIAEELKKKLGL